MKTQSKTSSTNDQIQLLQNQLKTCEIEKIQLKNELFKLQENLSQMQLIREKAAENESKLASVQKINLSLTQQINQLKQQNSQLLQELSAQQNQNLADRNEPNDAEIALKTKENQLLQTEINQLNQKMKSLDERHQIELAMRDDLIIKLKESLKSSKHSKGDRTFELDYEQLANKYLKKKSELLLFKQQFEEELKSNECLLHNANNECGEIKKKFHLLKKKYNDQKTELSSLKSSNEKLVKQLESMSFDLQRMNSHFIPSYPNDYYQNQFNHPISYVQGSNDIQELKDRAEKAENELLELRCLLKVMTKDNQKVKQPQRNMNSLYNQLEELGNKIDHLKKECSDMQPKTTKSRNPPVRNRSVKLPQWRRFQDF